MGESCAKRTDLVAHMVSCHREPNYAINSVRHFRGGSDMPLVVFVDGDDDSYLGSHEGVATVVSPVADGDHCPGWAYDRCRLNTIRAVEAVPEGADLLLLEDDIALRRDWGQMLLERLEVCRRRFGSEFVLSLYSAVKPGKRIEQKLAGYHYRDYYGNIAVVLSSDAVKRFLEVAAATTVPADMIVKEMLWRTRMPLMQTSPNMAQHLGDISTTGVRRVIRSASFRGGFAGGSDGEPKPKPSSKRSTRPRRSTRSKPTAKSNKDDVHISIATQPERLDSLHQTLNSLEGQADKIHVYLNGHTEVPERLRGAGYDFDRSEHDGGAVMKFRWADHLQGYLFTCDDDIIYPPDYVERVVDGIERYRRQAVVGLHGVTLKPEFQSYLRDREVFHCEKGLVADAPVHIVGTGTLAYHSSTIKVSMKADLPYPNMTDIWFGIACQKRRVPIMCLARRQGWLEVVPQLLSIFDGVERDDSRHSRSVVRAMPWTLHEPKGAS